MLLRNVFHEIPLHTHHDGYNGKSQIVTSMDKDVEKLKPSRSFAGYVK